MPQAPEGEVPSVPLIEGLRHELLAAAFRNHANSGQEGLQQFHYYFPEYEQLVLWRVGTACMRSYMLRLGTVARARCQRFCASMHVLLVGPLCLQEALGHIVRSSVLHRTHVVAAADWQSCTQPGYAPQA